MSLIPVWFDVQHDTCMGSVGFGLISERFMTRVRFGSDLFLRNPHRSPEGKIEENNASRCFSDSHCSLRCT